MLSTRAHWMSRSRCAIGGPFSILLSWAWVMPAQAATRSCG